jgi:hypothetical protein
MHNNYTAGPHGFRPAGGGGGASRAGSLVINASTACGRDIPAKSTIHNYYYRPSGRSLTFLLDGRSALPLFVKKEEI